MPQGFPPAPIFPIGIDSDYTLYLVYNTTETVTSVDNQAWEDEIAIVPVGEDESEIWADNGFATIEGELLYYDAVDTDVNGKVAKLKRCARNLGGKQTKFNLAGTSIRGFVVAEHHNQLVDAIIAVEDFVGVNFDTDVETLDYRIRNLDDTPVIFDDFTCPDVTLNFEIIENDPATGIVAQYLVEVTGTYGNYTLDFGDGTTTNTLQGTHTYAPNSTIDPVVTISNNNCQIIQTPVERTTPNQPNPTTTVPPFDIATPEFVTPPNPTFSPVELPPPEITPPPIVFPCLDFTPFPGISISIGDIDVQVPSVISFTPINIPSVISFTPINIPSVISITPVNIPSIITFGPAPTFTPIGFGPAPVIAPIGFGPAPVIAPIDITITIIVDIPSTISLIGCDSADVRVDWGTPPTLNVAFAHQLASQKRRRYHPDDVAMMKELGEDYKDFYPDQDDTFQVEYDSIGIPSEITIVPPQFPDIKVIHDLPKEIKIVSDDVKLDGTIQILPPKTPIPTEIYVVNRENGIPSFIQVISDLPSVIRIEHTLPERIMVEGINIPTEIRVDASGIPDTIQVTGFPESIALVGPSEIKLTIDEDLEVPLVYRGAPIEFKVEFPKEWTNPDGQKYPCVQIVPCG
jgi:hypothetical protein